MFGHKSSGILGDQLSTLPVPNGRDGGRARSMPVLAPETPGAGRLNETYIAATQFTMVSMPFFRWTQ